MTTMRDDEQFHDGVHYPTNYLIAVLQDAHEAEQAAQDAEKAAGRPADRVMVWFLRGAIAERQKNYEEAEEQFKRVLAAEPHESSTLNYYGYMLADRGVRLEEAVGLIQRALADEPYNGAFLDSLGWAYFKQGKLEQLF